MVDDLGQIHASLQEALAKLSLPALPPLRINSSKRIEEQTEREGGEPDDSPYDASPTLSPKDDELPHAPIDSLYQITRLKNLRSDDSPNERKTSLDQNASHLVNDFISRGLITIEDADRLVNLFNNRIDHFMYKIGSGTYRDLDSLRRGSSILTAAICTVAALHDPTSNHLYTICGREFRRLMSASMFDRRLDQDCMRAMCIASYWLHDLSWMLSGYAIRRAMEVNLSSSYQRVLENNDEEAMNSVRIWYVLYICDRHLSILYGRPSIVRDDLSVSGWEDVLKSSMCTESDKRLISQMALLVIMGNARELFGPDTGEPIATAFASHLNKFSRQIDQWAGYWSTELLSKTQFPLPIPSNIILTHPELHESIGEFPTKGVILHHHLAKLHLHSHVFRGLKGRPVAPHFETSAIAAVTAATSIIEYVLTDDDVRDALVGIPHYIHSMIAFACVFLLKIAAQHSGQYIDDNSVIDLVTRAVRQFRATPVGKWHLVQLMAGGLEKMLRKKTVTPRAVEVEQRMATGGIAVQDLINAPPSMGSDLPSQTNSVGNGTGTAESLFGESFEDTFNFGTASFLNFDVGDGGLEFGGFGF